MATKEQEEYYTRMLGVLGSLTRLFSDSKEPFLYYRVTENLFCKAFGAENVSRSDVAVDATIGTKGIGIKTFLNNNGKTFQKIAEFNKESINFRTLEPKELVLKVSQLRNERIKVSNKIYALKENIYHCVVREKGMVKVFECPMDFIETTKIKIIKRTNNNITFRDSKNEYSFNITKSTLFKRFITQNILFKIKVDILNEPYQILENKFSQIRDVYFEKIISEKESIILPLYSKGKIVQEKSALNQWNAGGRVRDPDEIYIQIPSWIHQKFPKFFLPRDTPFELVLPNKKKLQAKVCQDNSKALMSKHNADLGKWLLREVLELKPKELLTYKKLAELGIDSVEIEKIDKKTYSIDFRPTGKYEEFLEQNQ